MTVSERHESLLKWYEFKELPDPMVTNSVPIATTPLPPGPGMIGPEVLIPVTIVLRKIRSNDRIGLSATIVWSFGATTTTSPQITAGTQQMQFTVWRDAPLTGKRVGAVVDSGHLDEFTASGSSVTVSNTVTTILKCTDTGVIGKSHQYFLTASALSPTGLFATFGGGGGNPPQLITTFMPPTITEAHFSGSTIDENET